MKPLPVMRGTLDVLVLRALATTPMHGFEITTWLESRSNGLLEIEDGTLYHAIVRLEERRAIQADWGVTENGRRARYYSLTSSGRALLRQESKKWEAYSAAVSGILSPDPV